LKDPGERHASWLELFFDLVLVAAVAALATQLHADHSVAGANRRSWWAWADVASSCRVRRSSVCVARETASVEADTASIR